MRIGYFDCFSGASGDMILGACVSAGVELDFLRGELSKLGVEGYTIDATPIRKQGFAATQFEVRVEPSADRPHRHLKHVREIIEASSLSRRVREWAVAIFTRLAEAEAAVHDTTIEKVRFHEVGAVDAMVDVVGACIALDKLGLERIACSPVPTGSGIVRCEHGLMPVPAPATAALLKGVPLAACDEPSELTTPTGAAILTTLSEAFGPLPAMTLETIGVGAGQRDGQTRPNILRLLIGQAGAEDQTDEVLVLEVNLDDVSGQVIGYVHDRLFEAGALEVYATAVQMKKNRPGTLLTVLAPPALREQIEGILFAETTTLGVRGHLAQRHTLSRSVETVETQVGPIRVKIGRRGDQVVTASPEYEDCREAARRTGRPLREVMDLATHAWQAAGRQGGSS